MQDDAGLARIAALAGGKVLQERSSAITGIRSKSTATDFVSDVDVAAGIAIARELMTRDPNTPIVVEEHEVYDALGLTAGDVGAERVWVVDPLDGTTSYVHGYPFYSVSVALVEAGTPVAGAVYAPVFDQMHSGLSGTGAILGDGRLRTGAAARVQDALLVTGFPYDRGAPLDTQLEILGAFLRAPVHGIRRDGSAALDLCHVAAGRADGFWEFNLQPWDMAAGVLLCREAGALVTDANGADWSIASTSVVAANPTLHAAMLEVIRSVS